MFHVPGTHSGGASEASAAVQYSVDAEKNRDRAEGADRRRRRRRRPALLRGAQIAAVVRFRDDRGRAAGGGRGGRLPVERGERHARRRPSSSRSARRCPSCGRGSAADARRWRRRRGARRRRPRVGAEVKEELLKRGEGAREGRARRAEQGEGARGGGRGGQGRVVPPSGTPSPSCQVVHVSKCDGYQAHVRRSCICQIASAARCTDRYRRRPRQGAGQRDRPRSGRARTARPSPHKVRDGSSTAAAASG